MAEIILGIVGVVLQLIFRFVPGASDWYQAQSNKGPIMLGAVLLVSGVYFAMGCVAILASTFHIGVTCDVPGALSLVKVVFDIALGNQLAYLFLRNLGKK